MFKHTIAILVSVSISVPATASDQLAQSLGVEPGTYDTAQLVRLKSAIDEGDRSEINAILNGIGGGRVSTKTYGGNAGHQQFAAGLGVSASRHTTAQLQQMQQAREDDGHSGRIAAPDSTTVATFSTRNARTTPGHVQMAQSLGVDPAQHSTADLARMRTDRWSD